MTISVRLADAFIAGLLLAVLSVPAAAQMTDARQAAAQELVRSAQSLSEEQIQQSQDVRALEQMANLYQRLGDKERYRWTMKRLTQLVPGSLPVKMALAASYAADDMKTPAYDLLLRMKGQGFGIDVADMPEFEKIHNTQVWQYIVDNLRANLQPFGEGRKAFDLPAADLLVTSLAWDPVHGKFLAGSARDGSISHVGRDGKMSSFIRADASNGLWSIFALAVDAERGRLWAATTSVPHFRGYDTDNAGQAAVVEFDLKDGRMLNRYPLPGYGVFASALALAPDGTPYVADGVKRVIYTITDGKLVEMTRNPQLNNIRALAVSTDGKRLYLADTVIGILGIDLESGTPFGLGHNPEALVLPGIVGMYPYKDTLVVIEPGMQPQRVMRLSLSADGHSITKVMPLDVANPAFVKLGPGTVVDNRLYFLADDQRGKYTERGILRDGAVLGPVPVFESDLDFAWDESGINVSMQTVPVPSPEEARKLLNQPVGGHTLPAEDVRPSILKKP